MKPSASRIERMLAKVEAKVAPPSRVRLSVMVDDTDAEAVVKEKMEKALAEHVAAALSTAARNASVPMHC
jgi:hypothetical protein